MGAQGKKVLLALVFLLLLCEAKKSKKSKSSSKKSKDGAVLVSKREGNTDEKFAECEYARTTEPYQEWLNSRDVECQCSQCTGFLTNRCCSAPGVQIRLAAFEHSTTWYDRVEQFNNCTGAQLSVSFPADEDDFAEFLLTDLGDDISSGANLYDGYIVQAPWLPSVHAGLEDLTKWIRSSPVLGEAYDSINVASKRSLQYDSAVRALALDTDYIAAGYRQDVFMKHGITEIPTTIQELVELSAYLNGKDHNGDGEPDWGFCWTPQPNYFYAFVAPILQTKTCEESRECQNIFFNSTTFEPLIHNAGFKYAVEQLYNFTLTSNCHVGLDPSTEGYCDRKTAFPTGRCAGVISLPGTMSKLLGSDPEHPYAVKPEHLLVNVSDIPEGHWGRRIPFPGSSTVFNHDKQTLTSCTLETCPHGVINPKKEIVNRAPFFAEGGEAYAIRRHAENLEKAVLVDLITWFSTLDISELPLSGQYSKKQLEPEEVMEFAEESQWPAVMVKDLFDEVLAEIFDDDVNYVMDLLIPGFADYMHAVDEELFTNFVLKRQGFSTFSEELDHQRKNFDDSYNIFVKRLNQKFDVVTLSYGRLHQLQHWRASLGAPSLSDQDLCLRDMSIDPLCDLYRSGSDNDVEEEIYVIVLALLGAFLFLLTVGIAIYGVHSRKSASSSLQEAIQDTALEVKTEIAQKLGEQRWGQYEMTSDWFLTFHKIGESASGISFWEGQLGFKESTLHHVYIKKLKPSLKDLTTLKGFLHEGYLLSCLQHPCIIRGQAVQFKEIPLMIATEVVKKNLCDYMKEHGALRKVEQISVITNIARGLAYLHSKNILHKDMCARNVVIAKSIWDIRIINIGTNPSLYENLNEAVADDDVPVKWAPIEAIMRNDFSEKSDAWSFAVTVWEILSGGQVPWENHAPLEAVVAIAQGERLQLPASNDIVYRSGTDPENRDNNTPYFASVLAIMNACWTGDASKRPKLAAIKDSLEAIRTSYDGEMEELRNQASRRSLRIIENFVPEIIDEDPLPNAPPLQFNAYVPAPGEEETPPPGAMVSEI